MTPLERQEAIHFSKENISKRRFLAQLAAASAAAILWPSGAEAVMELWESGDPLCVVPYPTLDKPDGYELDLAYLETCQVKVTSSRTSWRLQMAPCAQAQSS